MLWKQTSTKTPDILFQKSNKGVYDDFVNDDNDSGQDDNSDADGYDAVVDYGYDNDDDNCNYVDDEASYYDGDNNHDGAVDVDNWKEDDSCDDVDKDNDVDDNNVYDDIDENGYYGGNNYDGTADFDNENEDGDSNGVDEHDDGDEDAADAADDYTELH